MITLPIDSHLRQIISRLGESRSLVLVAEPGAGKTTRVPPAILAADLLSPAHPNLVMLQPRRVAARASAQRIADERGWELGRQVGYQVRLERRMSADTRLRVVTEGILTRQLLDDPYLEGIGAVVLDEFHERSLHTDVAISLLREVRDTVRPDLMLIVMSATLEAEPVARFLGDVPIIRVEGRTFAIEIEYENASGQSITDRAAAATRRIVESTTEGDVLVFLPGAREIQWTLEALGSTADRHDLLLLPLHGSLPFEQQAKALAPANRRKIICSTNIAETSLTIDGVRHVIDTGLARVPLYDPQRGLDRLELERISKASATQRAGRAGRTAPGRCIRLWTAKEHAALADFDPPEIRRVDLAGTVLALHAWGKPDPRAFNWYEPPPEETLLAAERLLAMLGALSAERDGLITEIGRRMMSLPVHPRLGRLLVDAAEHGVIEQGAAIAAILAEKDFLLEQDGPRWARSPTTQGVSDLLVRLDLLDEAERSNFAPWLRDRGIDVVAARQVARIRDELLRLSQQNLKRHLKREADESTLLKLALLAYPDRAARRRASDPAAGAMVGGGGVRLAESVVRQPEFFVALDARADARSRNREAIVRIASGIEECWLEELFPNSIRQERAVEFDPQRQRVAGVGRTWYRDLLIREDASAAVDPEKAAAALAEALRPRAAEIFAANESAAALMARVALLRQAMPEHLWPKFDEKDLADALREAARGRRSVEELQAAPLAAILQSRLAYPLDRLLDQHAPESVLVPSGNHIRIDYSAGQKPVLAARLQELFGWTDTPRIAAGRVPLVLHLLGPNYRPVQITEDLKSFWAGAYFQVRKDLRVRYPKHSWPEDPLTAKAESRGGRRQRG